MTVCVTRSILNMGWIHLSSLPMTVKTIVWSMLMPTRSFNSFFSFSFWPLIHLVTYFKVNPDSCAAIIRIGVRISPGLFRTIVIKMSFWSLDFTILYRTVFFAFRFNTIVFFPRFGYRLLRVISGGSCILLWVFLGERCEESMSWGMFGSFAFCPFQ